MTRFPLAINLAIFLTQTYLLAIVAIDTAPDIDSQ
jgi:hypothetical protein